MPFRNTQFSLRFVLMALIPTIAVHIALYSANRAYRVRRYPNSVVQRIKAYEIENGDSLESVARKFDDFYQLDEKKATVIRRQMGTPGELDVEIYRFRLGRIHTKMAFENKRLIKNDNNRYKRLVRDPNSDVGQLGSTGQPFVVEKWHIVLSLVCNGFLLRFFWNWRAENETSKKW